ncbi:MAG: NAD(P)/FAD-dependent oxidoreductase, partial [Acidimicrobiia bacterium]
MAIRIDIQRAVAAAEAKVFWIDNRDVPERADSLEGGFDADLVVVGSGFSGLWAALQAVTDSPGRNVVVVDAETTGFGASSRNGGFLEASLTHGLANGVSHWPDEIETLERLGDRNFTEIIDLIRREALDVGLEVTGATEVATQAWHLEEIATALDLHTAYGQSARILDTAAMRQRLDSPTYLAGLFVPEGTAIIHPARLAWGLRTLAERGGVTFFDDSPVARIERDGSLLIARTSTGNVSARKVLVATNAYGGPVKRMRRYIAPVYDYVLMTEPLSTEQMASLGWEGREGVSDVSNQFHYYRLTTDNRVLWGGYDAVYRFNNAVGSEYD